MQLCDIKAKDMKAIPVSLLPELPEGVPPLRAFYLYLSTGCNLHCRHCWVVPRFVNGRPDHGEVIDLDLLRSAVQEAKPLGLCSAKITGGEPMLHPRFRELAEMLSDQGLGLNMETNGTLITPEMARWLKERTKIEFISVSLDGDNAASHDWFRGVPGAFEATLHGLDCLVEAGHKNVQVISCIHRGNLSQVDGVIKLAKAHGAGSVKVNPVNGMGRGGAMERGGETLSLEERMALVHHVREDLARDAGINLIMEMPPALKPFKWLWDSRGRCGDCGVDRILGILGSGEIAMCGIGRTVPELVYGRLGDSIRDIWINHPKLQRLRKEMADVKNYPGICGSCVHARSCRTNCVAANFFDDSRLVWPSEICTAAAEKGRFPRQRLKA